MKNQKNSQAGACVSGVAVTDNMLHLVVTRITNSIICNTQVILDADIIIMMPRFVFIYICIHICHM